MEENKICDGSFKPILQTLSRTQEIEIKNNDIISKHDISIQINEENEVEKCKKLLSTHTQTMNLVDSQIQTEPDMNKLENKVNKNYMEKNELKKSNNSTDFEIPTKDCEVIKNSEKNSITDTVKHQFTCSSPIKLNKNINQPEFLFSNKKYASESKKSPVATNRIGLKKSSSLPVKNQSKSTVCQASIERPSLTSSFASTVSSVGSSITNVTGRESTINFATSSLNQIDNQKLSEDNQTIGKNEDALCKIDRSQTNESNYINLTNEYISSFDESDKELFESDDILRILLKKTYFYQLKLK